MSFFEKLTDGLRLYEVILLLLGAIMFLALVVIMIVYASQRRTLKPLLIFFAVPVLMLVWPSVQKIKIDGTGAEIDKQVAAVEKDPSPENKEKLLATVKTLEDRNVKDPDVVKKMAVAQYLLGDENKSNEIIKKLPTEVQQEPEVKNLRESIIVTKNLKARIDAVKADPVDSNKIRELNIAQIAATQLQVKNQDVTNDIKIADQKVTEYKRINPRIKMQSTRISQ